MHFPDSHGGNQNTSCVPLDQALNLPGPRFCLYELGSLPEPRKDRGASQAEDGVRSSRQKH